MDYFTLAEDLEEIQSAKTKLRNRIFIGLFTVVLFFLLRSLGVVNIEYNRTYFKGNHQIGKEIYEVNNNGEIGTISNNQKTNNINTNDKDFYSNFGIYFKGDDFSLNEKEYLKKLIKEKISKERNLSRQFEFAVISIDKLELSGVYWLPLIKTGKSSYRISVENRVFKDTYSADFSGEIDLEIHGLCTINKLEKILADKIAKIVVNSIKDDYKK